ncbi:MAG: hypothetical protein QOG23_5792, partial [Blastocatellia bacterium]|nr:hypothetical protein [Blastocatellia bacterium]
KAVGASRPQLVDRELLDLVAVDP